MTAWVCVAAWGVAMFAVAVAPAVAAVLAVRRSAGAWGDRVRLHESATEGPYRAGDTTERTPRAPPLAVWLTAVLAPAWGSVTFLAPAPLVGLLVLRHGGGACPQGCSTSTAHALLTLSSMVLTASGIALAFRLLRDALRLLGESASGVRASRATATLGVVHHAALFAFIVAVCGMHRALDGLLPAAILCSAGLVVALLQWRASADVARALAEAERASA